MASYIYKGVWNQNNMGLFQSPKIDSQYPNQWRLAHKIEVLTFITFIIFILSILFPIQRLFQVLLMTTGLLMMIELLIFANLGISKKEMVRAKMPRMWFLLIFNLVNEIPLKEKDAVKAGYLYLVFAIFIFIVLIILGFRWFIL